MDSQHAAADSPTSPFQRRPASSGSRRVGALWPRLAAALLATGAVIALAAPPASAVAGHRPALAALTRGSSAVVPASAVRGVPASGWAQLRPQIMLLHRTATLRAALRRRLPVPAAPVASAAGQRAAATAFGSDVYVRAGQTFASALAHEDATFGTLRSVRVYFPGLPNGWPLADQPERTIVVSFKAMPRDVLAGKDDAALLRWFTAAPRAQQQLYWSYFHEPEDNIARGEFTAADYRAAWAHIAALAASARNQHLVPTLILMAWTLNPASGRHVLDYYPGSAVIGELGWDAYNEGARRGVYDAPASIYGQAAAVSASLGKPWAVAETGSLLVSHDDGTRRAAWIRSVGAYLAASGASWVTYFDAPVGGAFQLTDASSQQAWRSVVSG